MPNLLFPSNWPYLKPMLSSWFDFFLDYRAKTLQKHPNMSENEMNNSLAA